MTEEDEASNIELLRSVMEALNRHDANAAMPFFADDCVFELNRGPRPWGRRVVGKEAVHHALATLIERFPDAWYADASHWVCGDRGASEWTLVQLVLGERVPLFGGCDLWEFREGKIIRRNSFRKLRPGREELGARG